MKISTLSFPVIFLSLVLAAASAPGAVRGQLVLDTSGNPVRLGVPYYIVPAKAGTGGGLVPSSRDFTIQKLCPLDVVQSPFPFIPGLPVAFYLTVVPALRAGYVLLGYSINIEFNSSVWLCPESKVWKVVASPQLRRSVISTGGPAESFYISFQIAKEGDAYKIQYCVQDLCNDVGVLTDKLGVRRLVLGGEPFTVKFQKAYKANDRFEKTMLRMLPF